MADRVIQNGISIREMAGREGSDVTGPGDSAELVFLCKGSDDPLACRQALLDQTFYNINDYDGLILSSIARERITDDSWEFTCSYANAPEPGGYTVAIDTTGASFNVTEAFAQVIYPAPGETPTEHGTAINVTEGKAEGVDRVIGALKLQIRAKITSRWITSPIAYAKLISTLTGTTNNAPYLGFAAGELLFTGATGEIVGNDPTLTFTFQASPNQVGLQVGPITGITKAGHDYLWVQYEAAQDSSGEQTTQKPLGAFVARVYGASDFTVMGIGDP